MSKIAHPEIPPAASRPLVASTSDRAAPRGTPALVWLWRTLPTLLVICTLAAIAYWGHSREWTLPKFSSLFGNNQAVEDWCKEHGVPETQCIECNKSLLPPAKDYGWCKAHGVAQCPLDHPDVAQLKVTPVVSAEELERVQRALALRPRPENSSRCTLHEHRIQFASLAAMDKAGVDIAIATPRPLVEAIIANGEVVYDQTHMAHLASRVAGTVWRVEKHVGDRVREGEVLALIDAADVGKAKAEFLQAIAQVRLKEPILERLRPLAADGSVPDRQMREAEAALQEAKIRLKSAQQTLVNLGLPIAAEDYAERDTDEIAEGIQFLGVPQELIAGFNSKLTTSNLFPLRSPLDGVVVARKIVSGEVVDTTTVLLAIADVRQMWLTLDVRQDDARYLALGQTVLFRPGDNREEPEISGALAWISTEVDDQTRTVKVRVNLPNADGHLRANTFGTGRIILRAETNAIVVPNEAVHRDGDCNLVFVRDKNFLSEGAPKFFHVRKVRTGVKDDDGTEIIVGLLPGEVIASKNSVVLESQLLKSSLGAGCCEVPAADK